jgi:hypothetical protein
LFWIQSSQLHLFQLVWIQSSQLSWIHCLTFFTLS